MAVSGDAAMKRYEVWANVDGHQYSGSCRALTPRAAAEQAYDAYCLKQSVTFTVRNLDDSHTSQIKVPAE